MKKPGLRSGLFSCALARIAIFAFAARNDAATPFIPPVFRHNAWFGCLEPLSSEENRMGPTNIALVKLFRADQNLRTAQERYDTAARSVRLLERKVADLTAKLTASQKTLREQQATAGN